MTQLKGVLAFCLQKFKPACQDLVLYDGMFFPLFPPTE